MPFQFPTTEMFFGEQYRLCHSPEEYAKLTGEGWSDQRKAGATYKPYTAVKPPEPPKVESKLAPPLAAPKG